MAENWRDLRIEGFKAVERDFEGKDTYAPLYSSGTLLYVMGSPVAAKLKGARTKGAGSFFVMDLLLRLDRRFLGYDKETNAPQHAPPVSPVDYDYTATVAAWLRANSAPLELVTALELASQASTRPSHPAEPGAGEVLEDLLLEHSHVTSRVEYPYQHTTLPVQKAAWFFLRAAEIAAADELDYVGSIRSAGRATGISYSKYDRVATIALNEMIMQGSDDGTTGSNEFGGSSYTLYLLGGDPDARPDDPVHINALSENLVGANGILFTDAEAVALFEGHGAIVEYTDNGAIYSQIFNDQGELEGRWADLEAENEPAPEEEEEEPERQEDDWTTEDHVHFNVSGTRFRELVVPEGEDMWTVLEAEMERQGFFPNVWFIDDHGGETLMTRPDDWEPIHRPNFLLLRVKGDVYAYSFTADANGLSSEAEQTRSAARSYAEDDAFDEGDVVEYAVVYAADAGAARLLWDQAIQDPYGGTATVRSFVVGE